MREEKRDVAKYGFIITNLLKEDIYPIYRLRWQIELDFKSWKSILEIDKSTRKLKKERIEIHFYGKLCNILMNNELSNILREEIEDKNLIFSEKKIFQKIKYYLVRIHHYDYKVFRIIDKLKIRVPKTCIKSRRKGEFSSDYFFRLMGMGAWPICKLIEATNSQELSIDMNKWIRYYGEYKFYLVNKKEYSKTNRDNLVWCASLTFKKKRNNKVL